MPAITTSIASSPTTNTSPAAPRAIVIGAGVGGLAAAIALERAGVRVTVLERALALRDGGAGIWLWPNALRALDALGAGDAARAAGVIQTSNRVRDLRGRTLLHVEVARPDGQPYASLAVRRGALLHALAAQLSPGIVRYDASVEDVTPGDRAAPADVRLADGTELVADLVVAADGVGSTARRVLFGSSGRRDAGFTAFRAVVPATRDASMDWGIVWGRGTRFGAFPLASDLVCWFAGFDAPADLAPDDALATVKARLAGWPDPVDALLAATRPADIRTDRVAICTRPPAWSRGRVALLGDAAHAMTPSLGQGACQALEDAVALGQAMATDGHDVVAALATYARRRRRRAEAIAARSIRMDRMVQITSPGLRALRDRVVAAAPAFLVQRIHRAVWGQPWR